VDKISIKRAWYTKF